MGYQIEQIELQDADQKKSEFSYALIYMISSRILCKTEELPEIDWNECLEARFFSEDKELHIFEREEEMQAVIIRDTDDADCMTKAYELENRYAYLGKTLLVQEYFLYDKDGQMYVGLTRLKGIQ